MYSLRFDKYKLNINLFNIYSRRSTVMLLLEIIIIISTIKVSNKNCLVSKKQNEPQNIFIVSGFIKILSFG